MNFLDNVFHLKEHGTDVRTEVMAGITTFMAMAYILAVNPSILGTTGMDQGAVFTATALSAIAGTFLMVLFSNYPFALAPGMGLNAYFAYTVCGSMGYSWEIALAAVFVEGIVFILLSLTNVREAIFNAIPTTLKFAVTAGIGLFIAFLGLKNANLIVANPSTYVSIFPFKEAMETGAIHSQGVGAALAFVGILITGVMMIRNVKGNILWGIVITWGVGIVLQLVGIYVPNEELGMGSLLPDFSNGISIPSMAPTFAKLKFGSGVLSLDFAIVVFAFLFVNLFDTLGTLVGVASKANMLDEEEKLPKIKGALLADAIATSIGALFGTSTTTTFVESAAGVAEGGRTGLTSVVVMILFGLSLFLSPIFLAIPSFATAPALVIVGFLMLSSVLKINFDDITEALPAFICIIAMPLMSSISEGIALGIISYVLLNVFSGKAKEKKITVLMYALAIIFILKYIFIA